MTQLGSGVEDSEIALDEHSQLLSETVGEKLYLEDGSATEYLKAKKENVVKITEQSLQAFVVILQRKKRLSQERLSCNILRSLASMR